MENNTERSSYEQKDTIVDRYSFYPTVRVFQYLWKL